MARQPILEVDQVLKLQGLARQQQARKIVHERQHSNTRRFVVVAEEVLTYFVYPTFNKILYPPPPIPHFPWAIGRYLW
jgi:hypothetical protein